MRILSIPRWTAIGRGIPLGSCLQKSGLPPLKNRESERKKTVISCAVLSFLLAIIHDIMDISRVQGVQAAL